MSIAFLTGSIRRCIHAGNDDLLTAGMGLDGLAGWPVPFADPVRPTAAELRRRAVQSAWKGLADLGPLGGYGRVYGAAPRVPGREYSAFARLPQARHPFRVLCQIPDGFDEKTRCLIVAPSSGSRGVYGPIPLAGAWGLPRGCAVVYTDKGTGTGYFDCAEGTGVALDGTRARAGDAMLEFEPASAPTDAGIAIKHAHSGDHPEADWGAHVLQAVRFGLAMLDEAFPEQAPFTPENTRIIAIGVSNGGGAVLQAAGLDVDAWLDGVVALEPNVHVPGHGRAIYDYMTEAALLMPCALAHARFATTPLARDEGGNVPSAWTAHDMALQAAGEMQAGNQAARADEALQRLLAAGWEEPMIASATCSTAFDVWRAVAVMYASAYTRAAVGAMPQGYSYRQVEVEGMSAQAVQATWWPDGTGIPPNVGVALVDAEAQAGGNACVAGLLSLRALWDGSSARAMQLRGAVERLAVRLPRENLPIWVVHGAEDGLVPPVFSSDPYIQWLREQGRSPYHWRVPHAQHFDAFLSLPEFGARYVPLLAYGYAVLDRLHSHLSEGIPMTDQPTPQPRPRGSEPLNAAMLNLPH